MLEVQKFLKGATSVQTNERALESLKEQTGIKATVWEDQLVVLNYCQIESNKRCNIAQECRSLVLELGTWEVVSRSFDRFFNYGEEPCPAIGINFMVAHEKVDGSLIGLFNYEGKWMYRTRSVIMPVSNINAWDVTWKDHIESALAHVDFNRLQDDKTYILELTSMENRVVTKYDHVGPKLTLLAIRYNQKGFYVQSTLLNEMAASLGVRLPRTYTFETMSECLTAAKELRNLEEGFVLYSHFGIPISKVKNPAYVAAHHLRGEGLNPKRIKDLIIMNEVDEYLAIFPEDKEVFEPYQDAYVDLVWKVGMMEYLCRAESLTQKEFALRIAHLPFKGILFSMRKGMTQKEAWDKCTTNTKYQLIDEMME